MAADILIIDDEADIRGLIAGILEDEAMRPASRIIPMLRWPRSVNAGRR